MHNTQGISWAALHALAAAEIEIAAALAWGLGGLGLGYQATKSAFQEEPLTQRPIDLHERYKTLGSMIPILFAIPGAYRNTDSSEGLTMMERLSLRAIPGRLGGKFVIALHAGFDAEELAAIIKASSAYHPGQPVLLIACQGADEAPILANLLGAEVTALSADVLATYPIPFSMQWSSPRVNTWATFGP